MAGYPFQGASGTRYIYGAVDTSNPSMLLHTGGCFIFARVERNNPQEPIPVFVGEAENMYGAITTTPDWNVAKARHNATLLYIHAPFKNQSQRRAEVADLVAAYHPAMNAVADKAAEDQE